MNFANPKLTAVALAVAGLSATASLETQAQNLFVANQAGTIFEISDGTVSTFASGLANPVSLAVNAQGDVFEVSSGGYAITEFTPGGGQSTFATINPQFQTRAMFGYLAMNAAGDLYADTYNDYIIQFTPTGTPNYGGDPAGPIGPNAMAFDGAGNMFIAQFGSPGPTIVPSCLTENGNTIASGSYGSLACDPAGDLFAVNSTGIIKFAPGGSQTPFYTGQAGALACDSQGDVYMTSTDGIVEFSSDGTDEGVVIPGLDDPTALAFQPAPEPSSASLFAFGIAACGLISRFRRKS